MSESPLQDAIARAAKASTEELQVGVVAEPGDAGVEVIGNKELGKGWSVAGSFSWMREKSWTAAAWLGWKASK